MYYLFIYCIYKIIFFCIFSSRLILCCAYCYFIDKYMYMYIYIYTECPRRNVKYFRRVFLMLNYTDITQNTYIQS